MLAHFRIAAGALTSMVYAVVQRGPWGKTVDVLRLFARLAPAAHGAAAILIGMVALAEVKLNAEAVLAGAVTQTASAAVLIENAVPAIGVVAVGALFGGVVFYEIDKLL